MSEYFLGFLRSIGFVGHEARDYVSYPQNAGHEQCELFAGLWISLLGWLAPSRLAEGGRGAKPRSSRLVHDQKWIECALIGFEIAPRDRISSPEGETCAESRHERADRAD